MIEIPKFDEDLIWIQEIIYSSHLIRTSNLNYYQIKEGLQQGLRMSTAGEEYRIQLAQERASKDLSESKVFSDLFTADDDGNYVWQWTNTGLRVPSGWEDGRYMKDKKGNKILPRIVLESDKEVGEVFIPFGFESIIVEWDEVFGIPAITREYLPWTQESSSIHFFSNLNPSKDNISGHYDVSIGRGSYWLRDIGQRCLCVLADYGRSVPAFYGSFRPVQDRIREKDVIYSNVDVNEIKENISERQELNLQLIWNGLH